MYLFFVFIMPKFNLKITNNESNRRLLMLFAGEFCATAMLLTLICACTVKTYVFPNNQLTMFISCGCAVGVVIQCFGCVTQAHINPAVSIASFMMGYMSLVSLIVYIVAQYLGAILGYAIFLGMVPPDALDEMSCMCLIHPNCSTLKGFLVEFILTSVLIFLCLAIWDERNAKFGDSIAIKFAIVITMICGAGANYTGASVNPARSFAPALFHMNFDRHWVYVLGHVLAATICPISWIFLFSLKDERTTDTSKSVE